MTPTPAIDTAPDPTRLPSILILDDDPYILELLSQMMRTLGYETVITLDSAQVALRILLQKSNVVDVIICDLNMPGMDGIEFLHILNASPVRSSVILLSGEGTRIMHTVQRLLDGGRLVILGALEKPARQADFRALLDLWKPLSARRPPKTNLHITADQLNAANRKPQWVLHYQPKVDLRSGALVSMEALIRWNHPDHGLVYPDSFVSIAEECGAIDELTEWVLAEAMRQLVVWQSQGLKIKMAINISMVNLSPQNFANRVALLAKSARASLQDVILEVTESRLMASSAAPLENLIRLRMKGCSLSIDDFGTGHSSLAQLRDIPFTELKIDRGFVHGARHNQIIRPILEGSIGIASRLGMTSVAEGVETNDDWNLLRELRCDLAQGYFIARPMIAAQVPQWHSQWQSRLAGLLES